MERRGTYIQTGRIEFDELVPRVMAFLEQNLMDLVIDATPIRGYHSPDAKSIWIRDYSDMLRGLKYFESDIISTVEHFALTQAQNGRIFDYFTVFPEKLPCERENWTKYVRVPVEADVEYRFVKAAYLAWQAGGDDDWILKMLPHMEKALHYIQNHDWRWEPELGLVKRPYTIDTWDFAYTAGKHNWLQFQIDKNTFWGIMHGDNSGYYEAFEIMSRLYGYFGEKHLAEKWQSTAHKLCKQMNRVCWNGRFYTHFVKLNPVQIPGLEEAAQLSMSNPMDINRGVADTDKAIAIIEEYQTRQQTSSAFAEWFSIDPPFPDGIFGDEKLKAGAYVNGGIMPLVGGELAKAAFEYGFEEYGVDILSRYFRLISAQNQSYLWYFPDGTPASQETSTSPEASPTDGWGSSCMLYAMIEGLAGVEDKNKEFAKVRLSPRWYAAGITKAEVRVEYASSQAFLFYRYAMHPGKLVLEIASPLVELDCHVLIPQSGKATSVQVNNQPEEFRLNRVRNSVYIDFSLHIQGKATTIIIWEN